MNQVTFLHCSGLNLGYGLKVSGYNDAKKTAVRREDLKKVFSKILEIGCYEKADFILISGKFIDIENIDQATLDFINEQIVKYLDMQIVILLDEDSQLLNKEYKSISKNENVVLLSGSENNFVCENKNTLIYGINKDSDMNINKLFNQNHENSSNMIMVVLASVPLFSGDDKYSSIETKQIMIENGVNYIAGGYSKNRINDEFGDGLVYNSGTPEPLGFDEVGQHGVFSVTVTKKDDGTVKKDIAFIQTAIRNYCNVEADISGCFTLDAVKDVILNSVKPNMTDIFNINLRGRIIPSLDYSSSNIKSVVEDYFFDLSIGVENVENYDINSIMNEPGIIGIYVKKLVDEINSTTNEKQKSILTKALYFGIQALDGRQIQF